MSTPEDILPTYARHAAAYAKARSKTLYEKRWLDRALNHMSDRQVLDLGCGSGAPIARYLTDRRAEVTGVDAVPEMIALFQTTLPRATAVEADMRHLDLGETFDLILAGNSFFHLSPDDQRAMFPVFQRHAAPGTILMLTTGPEEGVAIGQIDGCPVYHSSLSPADYRALFEAHGFEVIDFVPEDPTCADHSVWLARQRAIA